MGEEENEGELGDVVEHKKGVVEEDRVVQEEGVVQKEGVVQAEGAWERKRSTGTSAECCSESG